MNCDGAPLRADDPDGVRACAEPLVHLLIHFINRVARREHFDGEVGRAGKIFFRDADLRNPLATDESNIWSAHGVRVTGNFESGFSTANDTEIIRLDISGKAQS